MTLLDLLRDSRIALAEEGQHHHARPGWVQLRDCPWCGSASYHLGINVAAGSCACWKCGGHSTYKTLIQLGVSPGDLQRVMRERKHVPERSVVTQPLAEPKYKGPLLRAHIQYLKSRGFNPQEIVHRWNVEGIGPHGHLAWRLYIPVFHSGQKVSWTTRAIGEHVSQRYLSSSPERDGGTKIKDTLYGLDYCGHSVLIVEGPLDAWAVGPGAVALYGTAFTVAQVNQLARFPYRSICFDAEASAQRKASELANLLSQFPGTTQNVLLDAKDPALASPKELKQLRRLLH